MHAEYRALRGHHVAWEPGVCDGQRNDVEWQARARMNGSGNLLVRCEEDGDGYLELRFGNATFDGPRTYTANDFSSDGSVSYSTGPTAGTYLSGTDGASCELVLVEAGPLDLRGTSVERGGGVAATFTCSALISTSSTPPRVAVESGALSALVE